MKIVLILLSLTVAASNSFAQVSRDTAKVHAAPPVTIEASRMIQDRQHLPPVKGTFIYAGKKTDVIEMTAKNAALTEKYARQIFAKIPGVFVYDMDGTGNQMNISTRGLDPHRSWEFNVRKDDIGTNSDMYGYPASHYNMPMEAVEKIELVRGTGSLQYGAQFGGMLNYISKQPDTTRPFAFESINTMGSYGLVSNFNRLSGKLGDLGYSVWTNKKWITGYRDNSDSEFDAEAVSLWYSPSDQLTMKVEWTHSNYITHLPGPLTDSMFALNPQMSTRSRNYYNPDIHIPSLTVNWNLSAATRLQWTASAVLGSRNSVMYDKAATIADSIVAATLQYNNRQVDIDNFNSYTTELRVLHSYPLFGLTSTLTAGMQYMNNDLHRRQIGKGTTGSDFDLSLVTPGWGRDLHYTTGNIAAFAENRWLLTDKFSINTGMRMEIGSTDLSGKITYYADTALPNSIKHNFPLFGVSSQYNITDLIEIYAGWSQAYRPVIFKDIIPASLYEVADKNLKDAGGYTAEIGCRGYWKWLQWDVTGFVLQYNNRLGTLAQIDNAGNQIIYRTNIGNATTKGIEAFVQADFLIGEEANISIFSSTSYMSATYQNATLKSGNENVSINGNTVESVPKWITRDGITCNYSFFSFSALYSYTAESYADALNISKPSATGATGLVPSYQLLDLHVAVKLSNTVSVRLNINNVLNEQYFTKRPQFYPGPGIWPSDGRTLSGTVSVRV